MSSNNDFQTQWGVPWEVKTTIPGASSYLVENTTRKFSSGVIDVVFYDGARSEICRRSGMRLVSKAGRPYEVCRRDPEMLPRQHKDSTSGFSTEDVYD
jgi:hypothetical protein